MTSLSFLRRGLCIGVMGALVGLTGCAHQNASPDPYESINRKVFAVNKTLDTYALKPATTAYRAVVPEMGRQGVTNVFSNLGEPANAVNHALTGDVNGVIRSTMRFLVNTTFGVAGIFDVAGWIGNDTDPQDMGQTLATWGVDQGAYLMLPLLGPSTTREVWQWPVSYVTNPAVPTLAHANVGLKVGTTALGVVNVRNQIVDSGLDKVMDNVIDEYAALRNAYLQRRAVMTHMLNEDAAQPTSLTPLDFSDDEDDDAPQH